MNQDFINKIRESMILLETKKGFINMFGVFKMDDFTEKWSIVLGADWATEDNFEQTYLDLRSFLLKLLTTQEMKQIARFGIFSTENHLVEDALNKFKVTDGDSIVLKDQPLNGNIIHEGYLLRSSVTPQNKVEKVKA